MSGGVGFDPGDDDDVDDTPEPGSGVWFGRSADRAGDVFIAGPVTQRRRHRRRRLRALWAGLLNLAAVIGIVGAVALIVLIIEAALR